MFIFSYINSKSIHQYATRDLLAVSAGPRILHFLFYIVPLMFHSSCGEELYLLIVWGYILPHHFPFLQRLSAKYRDAGCTCAKGGYHHRSSCQTLKMCLPLECQRNNKAFFLGKPFHYVHFDVSLVGTVHQHLYVGTTQSQGCGANNKDYFLHIPTGKQFPGGYLSHKNIGDSTLS